MQRFVHLDQEDLMATLCRMVVNTKYEDLPSKVIDHAKRSIMDTLGVIIGGSAMDGIPAVVRFVKDKGGKAESFIPFYGGKVPFSEAAFAIAPMARAMDLGDYHDKASHTSEYTVPALLAVGSAVSGKELITAYVVGQEVMIRIGTAYKANTGGAPFGRMGAHCIFGIVAAVGKLLGMTQEELENAEGMASVMTQSHVSTLLRPATLMVRVQHGFVCQNAINACLLAQKGITGPRKEVLAAPNGYFGFAKWETDPSIITEALGEEWQMMGTMVKCYTSRAPTHTAIYAMVDSMKVNAFNSDDVAGIEVEVSSADQSLRIPIDAQRNPQTEPECQFSLPYVVATAALDGDVFIDSYTHKAISRQRS